MLTTYLKAYPLSLLTLLAITGLSLLPFPEVPQAADIPLADKWVHFLMYGGLSLMLWAEMARVEHRYHARKRGYTLWGVGAVGSAAWGGLMELGQAYLTTTRSGDWIDFCADALGALLGSLVGVAWRAWYLHRHKE